MTRKDARPAKLAKRHGGKIVHWFPRSGPVTACGHYEFKGGTFWSGSLREVTCRVCIGCGV